MAHIRDCAIWMINVSITMAEKAKVNQEDDWEKYYIDYTKLRCLLYLAQCRMLSQHGEPLFENAEILATDTGPFVRGIDFIADQRGIGKIKEEFDTDCFLIPSPYRCWVIDKILNKYGKKMAVELINLTKKSLPYREFESKGISLETKPVITESQMQRMGAFL